MSQGQCQGHVLVFGENEALVGAEAPSLCRVLNGCASVIGDCDCSGKYLMF